MGDNFIDYDRLRAFDAKAFEATTPFPWHNMLGFLTPRAFQELFAAFPTLELFERHDNLARKHGQRPHNRHYLAYESSIYHRKDATGVVRQAQLPAAWQRFMDELRSSREYHDFIRRALGIPSFTLRCAWHVGSRGSEVSPHLDATKKLGTHILYFNTSAEWNPDWGGETLVLGGRRTQAMNPTSVTSRRARPRASSTTAAPCSRIRRRPGTASRHSPARRAATGVCSTSSSKCRQIAASSIVSVSCSTPGELGVRRHGAAHSVGRGGAPAPILLEQFQAKWSVFRLENKDLEGSTIEETVILLGSTNHAYGDAT